ncbi:uncharacterized protein KY384_002341 [Bacidia gigantensis]|uniref:uncharacterized protein n=1 Tax=Bacidia gigantensis TaxID=2732470 RepID=UPI001D045541|nr:uncharacterized protein KY384_002341 [Bacidia gigantensis]KAG8532464.1 hypothetical protein KY384_002341 [Bacidia gigantensis]
MDPLSLAPFILSVIVISEKTGFLIKDLISRYKSAPITLTLIQTEIITILDALRRLERLCQNDPDSISTRFSSQADLVDTFDSALTGCVTVISCIEHELCKVSKRRPFQSIKWTGNIKFMFTENAIKALLQHLGGQRGAIQLLLQSLQVETMASMHQKQDELAKILRARMADSRSLRERYPQVRPPESIIQGTKDGGNGSSTLSGNDAESLGSTTERAFDQEVIDSKVYRRTFSQYEKIISRAKTSETKAGRTQTFAKDEPKVQLPGEQDARHPDDSESLSSRPSSISVENSANSAPRHFEPLEGVIVELPADTASGKPLDINSVFSTVRSASRYNPTVQPPTGETYAGVDREAVIASSSARFHLSMYERDILDSELFSAVSDQTKLRPNMQKIATLLDRGAYINAQHSDSQYEYALQALCSWSRDASVVELLLRRGADVNATGGCFGNALAASCSIAAEDVVELLLRAGADPSVTAIRSLLQSRQVAQRQADEAETVSDASSDYSITAEMKTLPGAFLQSWDESAQSRSGW